jgi:hypothetical protein
MSFGTDIAAGVAAQVFVRLLAIVVAVASIAGTVAFVAGRMTAPPSAYQQMRENDRQDLIRQKNLSKHDLELLGARPR